LFIPSDLQKAMGLVRVIACENGRATIEYNVGAHMCHSGGIAQGGFVGGWIDAAISTASNSLAPEKNPLTLELKVSYFSPTRPGIVIAEGWIERRGRTTCFGEGRLTDQAGQILAKASSTIRLVPRDMASAT